MIRPRAIALVGATATGKTALAETLARCCDAEVVCADSRQVFAELEIGTGRPSPEARATRPHHLFGILHLTQPASAGWYARAAGEACADIRSRGRAPLLVGGSGLYLRALREGLASLPPPDPELRRRIRTELETCGPEALHARLAGVDPASAARLAPRDGQRVSRALEVFEATGRPLSWWHARAPLPVPAFDWTVIELTMETAELRERIVRRTAWMFDHGLVEETHALLVAGHDRALRTLRAIGYEEAADLIAGRIERGAAELRVNQRTGRLAKRQRTWFRHQVEAQRLDASGETEARLVAAACGILRGAGWSVS